jgi:hypothetical protein
MPRSKPASVPVSKIEIASPRTDKQWMLKENGREIREEEEIAEVFN